MTVENADRDITRPIIGIENRTAAEVFDIMCDRIRRAHARQPGEPVASFQSRVGHWMQACFGPTISADRLERGDRLLEEVLELLQSGGYPPERVASLTGYVWSRPAGVPAQEVGGVEVTLAAYCLAHGLDKHEAGETELARIWTKVEAIRAKQAAKPTGSALPMAWPHPAPPAPVAVPDGLWERQAKDATSVIAMIRATLPAEPEGEKDSLRSIEDGLIQSILDASPEDVAAELRDQGIDPDEGVSLVDQMAEEAMAEANAEAPQQGVRVNGLDEQVDAVAAMIDARPFDPDARWHNENDRDRRRNNARVRAKRIISALSPAPAAEEAFRRGAEADRNLIVAHFEDAAREYDRWAKNFRTGSDDWKVHVTNEANAKRAAEAVKSLPLPTDKEG